MCMVLPGQFHAFIMLQGGVVWVGLMTYLGEIRKRGWVFLLLVTIFFVYLFKVFDYTLFQYQSLVLLQYFSPDLLLQGFAAGEEVNVAPLVTLTMRDLKTSLLNILLFVPFGFGLPFISSYRFKKVVILGMSVSLLIEFLQWFTGWLTGVTFRVADINDLIFNTLGAAIGYLMFIGFVYLYQRFIGRGKFLTLTSSRYVLDGPQTKISDK